MGNLGQHRGVVGPTRPVLEHGPKPVRRSNGDEYCRLCGQLLLCRHYLKARFYHHQDVTA